MFAATTAFQQSDGRHTQRRDPAYIVIPPPSRRWDHRASGVRGGSVAAVVHRGQVQYAVVGDTGPRDVIGEASCATAHGLGIPRRPARGRGALGRDLHRLPELPGQPHREPRGGGGGGERLARLFAARK
ncbi:glycoside hydrolase family 75 protein [Streptomyces tricolor]|nr:glycoside hydrolase family 75 protein [Streptomyces tricolor]